MGILNITPDSFYENSRTLDIRTLKQNLNRIIRADIIDIGAESTRPNSNPLTENEELEHSMILLNEIISKQRDYSDRDNNLIMNAHYDLGQIYLTRAFNYDLAINHFEYIFNNIYSTYGSVNPDLEIKNHPELKEKSLFMLGYIYHNHIGNFTLAQNYYSIFLKKFPERKYLSFLLFYFYFYLEVSWKKLASPRCNYPFFPIG